MHEEKRIDNLQWLHHSDLKFRIKKINDIISVIWVSKLGFDINFSLMFHDFLDYCRDEINIYIEIDSSWIQKGFKVRNNDIDIIIDEIARYVSEWEIEPNMENDRISEEVWYSI